LSDARKEAGRSGDEIALIVRTAAFLAMLVLVIVVWKF